MSELIKLGYKMKNWVRSVIDRDFGENVSFARGLYYIIKLYLKYVPRGEVYRIKKKNKKSRLIGENI